MKEVYAYGEIGNEVTALRIADEIRDEKGILLRVNSYGGDVFEAQAIYNLLRQREVNVKIDGICASAATLIACAGKKVMIPSNGIYMIHLPETMLMGYYNSIDLEKTKSSLDKITDTILEVYNRKTRLSEEKLRRMVSRETWMKANEARSQGFVDEILEEDPEVEDRIERVKMMVDKKKVKVYMETRENEESLFEKFKNWVRKERREEEVVEEERERVETLSRVQTSSIAQQAIINLAKKDGRTLEEIQRELDAISEAERENDKKKKEEWKAQMEYVFAGIRDYMASNAGSIKSSPQETQDKTDSIKQVLTYARELSK